MKKKLKMIADVDKFSFAQMVSNSNGKTSASGAMGVFICLIGGISFLVGAMVLIFKGTDSDILVQSISMVYAGALLLGFRKGSDNSVQKTGEMVVEEEVKAAESAKEEVKIEAPEENQDVQINS